MATDPKSKTDDQRKSAAESRADEQKAEAAAQGGKAVRDPSGVMTTVDATKGDPVGASGTPRDPNPLPEETGAQYTSRLRTISPEAQGRNGEPASASSPNDPIPLTGVAADEDPLGISTGRVAQTQIEQDSNVPVTVPGERDSEAKAAKGKLATDDEDDADADKPKRGKLPEDFPGRAALEANDITTYAQVRHAVERDQLTELNGIGDSTAERIKAEI